MKRIVLFDQPRAALRKHKNVAHRLLDKLEAYAQDGQALANQVKTLRGSRRKRLRVGDFRIIFEETETEILVTDIGPRGSVYG